jgi:epoxide hydrolase 4
LGRERCVLVGHDWGAAVAWETAIRHPERVENLAILNVPHPDVMAQALQSNWDQMRKSWYILAFQIPGLPEAMLQANDWERAAEILQSSRSPLSFTPDEIEQYRQAWRQKDAMTCMVGWYRAVFRDGVRGVLSRRRAPPRRVQMPVMILWGEQDVALSKELAQLSIDLCEQGELVFFPTATHWVQHDEAQAVNERLLGFLSASLIPRYNDAHAKQPFK